MGHTWSMVKCRKAVNLDNNLEKSAARSIEYVFRVPLGERSLTPHAFTKPNVAIVPHALC